MMAVHAASASAAVRTEFGAVLDTLGVTQRRVAQLFAVSPRHVRRWKSGARRRPPRAAPAVVIVCTLLARGVVTIEQVEAAAPAPARTNGSAAPEPPVPLLVEPAPEQSASARAPAPALADPGPITVAEKVCAL